MGRSSRNSSWMDTAIRWKDIDYIVDDKNNAPVEEAYKVLRTNIQFCGIDHNKTLTVTSTFSGEGKTTIAMNLAATVAKSGLKVLLVDADMRKPMATRQLEKKDKCGLSNILAGHNTFEEAVSNTNLENYFFLPCGIKPPNPTELLDCTRFDELIRNLNNKYDLIIFDTPPLGSVIDAAIVAAQTDGTIIVIESGGANLESVRRVKAQLEKANARIVGAVLNKMKKSRYKDYYSYYQYSDKKKRNRSSQQLFSISDKSSKIAL